jgi:uncharacterized membrane protein
MSDPTRADPNSIQNVSEPGRHVDPRELATEAARKIPGLRKLPEEERLQTIDMTVELVAGSFSGPLPHPQVLRQYESLTPGIADRIVRMAESDLAHSQKVQLSVAESEREGQRLDHEYRMRGQAYGFIVSVGSLLLTAFLAFLGLHWLAAGFGLASMSGLAWAFIHGRPKAADTAEPPKLPVPKPPVSKPNKPVDRKKR